MNGTKLILAGMFTWNALAAYTQDSSAAENNSRLAATYQQKMQPDSAIYFYDKASQTYNGAGMVEKEMNMLNQAGILLTRQDKYPPAKVRLLRALDLARGLPDSNNAILATTYISLGVVYNAIDSIERSLYYHFRALQIRQLIFGEQNAQTASSYGNIGNVYLHARNFDKAIEYHLLALKVREHLFGPAGAEVIQSYTNLGNVHREKKEYDAALDHFLKALQIKIAQPSAQPKELSRFYENISEVYYLMNNQEQGDFYKNKSEKAAGQ